MAKPLDQSAPLVILTLDEIHRACVRHVLMQKVLSGELLFQGGEDLDTFMAENHIQSRVTFREYRGEMFASVAIDRVTLKAPPKTPAPPKTSTPPEGE